MIKKIMCCFVLLILAVQPAIAQDKNESFVHILEGQKAEFSGYLFRPEALTKIYTEVEQKEKLKQVEYETKINLVMLEVSKLKEINNLEKINRERLIQKLTEEKNLTIESLQTKVKYNQLWTTGCFFGGLVLGGYVTYHIVNGSK